MLVVSLAFSYSLSLSLDIIGETPRPDPNYELPPRPRPTPLPSIALRPRRAGVRRVLGETPHDAGAHALLGLCLVEQDKLDEAQARSSRRLCSSRTGRTRIICRSVVLEHRKRFAEAEASAREAVRLEPLDADYHARLAATLFQQGKWQPAFDAATEGLAHDAEHRPAITCGRWRSPSWAGRARRWRRSTRRLRATPTTRWPTRTRAGPCCTRASRARRWSTFAKRCGSIRRFEYAQQGIVEALKARNPIYRWMLAYFLVDGAARATAPGGASSSAATLARGSCNGLARNNPDWAPWIMPILMVYLVFVLLTWFAYPLFNLLLRFNKFGWYALSRDQRRRRIGSACAWRCLSWRWSPTLRLALPIAHSRRRVRGRDGAAARDDLPLRRRLAAASDDDVCRRDGGSSESLAIALVRNRTRRRQPARELVPLSASSPRRGWRTIW